MAAAEDVIEHVVHGGDTGGSGDQAQDGHGGDEGHGGVPGDDLADHQVHAAQQQHQRGNLAQGAADAAQEHIHHGVVAGQGGQVAALHDGQGGGGGNGVSVGAEDGQLR